MLSDQSTTIAVTVDQVVDVIRSVGGGVRAEEIAYKLGAPCSAVVEALCEAEDQGLVTPWGWTLGPEARF